MRIFRGSIRGFVVVGCSTEASGVRIVFGRMEGRAPFVLLMLLLVTRGVILELVASLSNVCEYSKRSKKGGVMASLCFAASIDEPSLCPRIFVTKNKLPPTQWGKCH